MADNCLVTDVNGGKFVPKRRDLAGPQPGCERSIDTREFPWWKFCGVRGECENWMCWPWRFRGYTYATNIHVLVRCWGAWTGVRGSKGALNAVDLFEKASAGSSLIAAVFRPLESSELIQPRSGIGDCAGCFGRGRIGEDLCFCEADEGVPASGYLGGELCGECLGRGYTSHGRWVAKLGDQRFHGYYVRILAELPGIEWRPTDPDPRMDRPINFRWRAEPLIPAGEGLLMPLAYEGRAT